MPQKNTNLNEIINKILKWYFDQHVIVQAGILLFSIKVIRDFLPPISYSEKPKPIPRKEFSEKTKKFSRIIQGNVCNDCKKPTDLWDYHHRDGDRSNNRQSNCEALCPYCHAKKTRKSKSRF